VHGVLNESPAALHAISESFQRVFELLISHDPGAGNVSGFGLPLAMRAGFVS
jgi:hypothetical protein